MDLKNIVGSVAPFLGNLIGGPLGGTALTALSNAIFGKPDASEQDIMSALSNASPEVIAKIKQAEIEAKVELRKADVEEQKAFLADVQDARSRQIKYGETFGKDDPMIRFVVIVTVLGFFTTLFSLFFLDIPQTARDIIVFMSGVVGAKFGSIHDYYIGSSIGSKKKDDVLSKR